jgi:hypothetical protein
MTSFHVIRYQGDTFAAKTLDEVIEAAMFDRVDIVEHWLIKAEDAGAARLVLPTPQDYAQKAVTKFWSDKVPTKELIRDRFLECQRQGLPR